MTPEFLFMTVSDPIGKAKIALDVASLLTNVPYYSMSASGYSVDGDRILARKRHTDGGIQLPLRGIDLVDFDFGHAKQGSSVLMRGDVRCGHATAFPQFMPILRLYQFVAMS
jgi:hypothetical protein